MTRIRPKHILPALLVAALALPAAASAGTKQEALFQDDRLLLLRDRTIQGQALDEIQAFGVDSIHAIIYWRTILRSPTATRRPRGNGANPGNSSYYSPASWDLLDNLVRETSRRRFSLLLTPSAASDFKNRTIGIPRWARGRGGTPNPRDYSAFFKAVLKRYSGSYRDENDGGGRLPKVTRWSFWNEPNQGGWIKPQFKRVQGKTIPYSPHVYREIYQEALNAMRRTGHRRSRVYLGETAPLGDPRSRKSATAAMPPGLFLREMLCLDSRFRSYRGAEAKRRDCPRRVRLKAHGINHHFYTKGRGQPATFDPSNRDWFPIGAADEMVRFVDRVARTRAWPKRLKIYNTEFGFQSNPPDSKSGVTLDQQAEYENVSEYISYKLSRIHSFAHYLLLDDPSIGGFQTGLKLLDGSPKPAYAAFAMPLVVRNAGGGRVKVWGAAVGRRPGVTVDVYRNGVLAAGGIVVGNSRGYFDVVIDGSTADLYQLHVPANGALSRVARVSSGVR